MTIPSIFCPVCTTLILRDKVCSTCDWAREAAASQPGQIAWRQTLRGELGAPFAKPAAAEGLVFIPIEDGDSTSTVFALDAASGEVQWSHKLPAGRVVHHLIVHQDHLLIAPEDTRVLGENEVDLVALNASDGSEAWRCSVPGHSLTPPAIIDDRLFTVNSGGTGYLIDFNSGSIVQVVHGLPPWLPLQPVVVDGQFCVGGRSGQIVAVNPQNGLVTSLLSLPQNNEWFDKPLAAAEDHILAANWNRRLYAITTKGQIAWEADLERGASSPPTSGRFAFIGLKRSGAARSYGVAAFNLDDSTLVWFADTGRHVETPPLSVEEQLFVTSRDGKLLALNAEDGEELWAVELGDRPRLAPLLVDHLIICGTRYGEIVAINRQETSEDWDAIDAPDAYRAVEEWPMAGTAAALQEDWVAAAEDFTRAEAPAYAARLFARAEAWASAAQAYRAAGEPGDAVIAYRAAGDEIAAAGLLEEMGRFEKAARLYETLSDLPAAATSFEKAGMLAKAAPLFEQIGEPDKAANLYLELERPAKAAGALAAAGKIEQAAEILRQAGHDDEAAVLLEEAGQQDLAAAIWQSQGREEDALRLYLETQNYEKALEIARGWQDWALIRQLAFDLDRFELEAKACLEMATDATSNAAFDHYVAAGQALMRAAQALEQKHEGEIPREIRHEAADLWERAAEALENGLEDAELIQRCRRQALRLRRWPELTLDVAAMRELVAGEYHTLIVKLTNTGFGITRLIALRVLEERFDGDADHTQHIRGMRPGSEQKILLRVRPKDDAVGSAVPLDLELSYQLPNEEMKIRQIRGEVPVRQRMIGEGTPSPLDPLATRPAIEVYQESPEVELHRTTASAPPGLRQKMTDYLSETDVKTICFDLELDFKLLPGPSLVDKIRELIIYCERRKMIPALLEQCAGANEHVNWGEQGKEESGLTIDD